VVEVLADPTADDAFASPLPTTTQENAK